MLFFFVDCDTDGEELLRISTKKKPASSVMALPSAKPLRGYLPSEKRDALLGTRAFSTCRVLQGALNPAWGGSDPQGPALSSAGLRKPNRRVSRLFFTHVEQSQPPPATEPSLAASVLTQVQLHPSSKQERWSPHSGEKKLPAMPDEQGWAATAHAEPALQRNEAGSFSSPPLPAQHLAEAPQKRTS